MQGPEEEGTEETIGEINVIPFIDICLVLLIIVLVTSAGSANFKEVELPQSTSTVYRDMNLAITLTLDKEGNVFFEELEMEIKAKDLWKTLTTVQSGGPWSMVVIRSHKETPYECLYNTINCVLGLGCQDINLAVKGDEGDTESGAG